METLGFGGGSLVSVAGDTGGVALNPAVDPVGQAVGVLQIIVNSFARRIAKEFEQPIRARLHCHPPFKYKLISKSNSMADLSLQGRGATYKTFFRKKAPCYLGFHLPFYPLYHEPVRLFYTVLRHGLRTNLGSVVGGLVSANPGFSFNSGFLTALLKSLFWIIFFYFLKGIQSSNRRRNKL